MPGRSWRGALATCVASYFLLFAGLCAIDLGRRYDAAALLLGCAASVFPLYYGLALYLRVLKGIAKISKEVRE